MSISLADLVANRTMSPEMAATLAVAAEERRSMLFVAIPRLAGKTTTMRAALEHAPASTPFHHLSRSAGPSLGIPDASDGGYLVMSEISPVGFDDYLWGPEVQLVFERLAEGKFALATALHAGSFEEAMAVITHENGVPPERAASIDLVVYIRSIGEWSSPSRRAVATIHEVDGVAGGAVRGRLLHSWSEHGDRFSVEQAPRQVGSIVGSYETHLAAFRAAGA
jgi:hypothetical protein